MAEKLNAQFHHIAMSVKDFDKVKSFYVDTLGYDVLWDSDNRGNPELSNVVGLPDARMHIAMLEGYGMRIEMFYYYTPQGTERHAPMRQCDFGLTHFALQVKGLKGMYDRLHAQGVAFNSAPQNIRPGAWVAYMRDPEGNTIELVEYEDEASANMKK